MTYCRFSSLEHATFLPGISSAIARHSHDVYPPPYGIDGDVNSFYHELAGGPTPMWFQADLGSSKVRTAFTLGILSTFHWQLSEVIVVLTQQSLTKKTTHPISQPFKIMLIATLHV